mgnify:FL=1|jgi:hypothetical protein
MTRKDFTLVAKVVSSIIDLKTRNSVALDFASVLHKENDRFDTVRFLSACNCQPAPIAKQQDSDYDLARERFIAP